MVKKLPQFTEFARRLEPDVKVVRKNQQKSLLRKLYALAKLRVQLQNDRDYEKARVPEIRAQIAHYGKALTLLLRAIRYIDEFNDKARERDPLLARSPDVKHARMLLFETAKDLAWEKEQMLPGIIDRRLRRGRERHTSFAMPGIALPDVPGLGIAEVRYWFIDEANQCLDKCVTPEGKRISIGRDKLIKNLLQKCLDDWTSIESVKTARLRIARERRRAFLKSRQN